MGAKGSKVAMDCVRAKVVRSVVLTSPRRSLTGKPGSTTNCRRCWDSEHGKETLGTEGFLRMRSRRRNHASHSCCAGLDVHKERVSACISVCQPDGSKAQEVRVFGTFTRDLLALAEWLKQQ